MRRRNSGASFGSIRRTWRLERVVISRSCQDFQHAARDAQAGHEGAFDGRQVKEAAPFITENIILLRRCIGGGVLEDVRIEIERVQGLLDGFLNGQVLIVHGIGSRHGIGLHITEAEVAGGDSGEKTVQVLLLHRKDGLAGDLGEGKSAGGHGREGDVGQVSSGLRGGPFSKHRVGSGLRL